ncbi:hypothetical protein V6U89_24420 [Micromonospora sp. CPCC 206171]|uniref:nSTAND1 domain-containing NTPase n=1 Tax=Micromonospora sp. CPCC 206171 TaxID=3122405 RepID=UPI002FEFCA97
MDRIAVQDYQVLVLAEGETAAAVNNAKGHLFESFIASLLHEFGFDAPHERNVNVTSDGIELDVAVSSSFTKQSAIAEGKAYSTNVKAQALTSFYGKLNMARFEHPDMHGYLFALPRLVAQGHESARTAETRDARFHYFDAERVIATLLTRGLIRTVDAAVPEGLVVSDPALVIAKEGLYSCVKVLDGNSRRAAEVLVWGRTQETSPPRPVLDLLESSDYARELTVRDLSSTRNIPRQAHHADTTSPIVVSVRGSSSDFEYQFPASPEFFVGRRLIVAELSKIVAKGRGIFILNAQSGWGKSSLALKLKMMVERAGGYALVIDSRTANSPVFVTESLRIAAQNAASHGLLALPEETSWASLKSAVATLREAKWNKDSPLLIFFDQFENVFQDEETTRQFRDLALLLNEVVQPILLGFAWKTDLVGWTESHPYRLRDEIRAGSDQIVVGPMGAKDVEALLRRLEKRIGQSLARELRQRLREYSQGLPWLFKKLAGHVIREIEDHAKTQEQLVSEALNVQSLFDSDLAGLQPIEKDAVRHVARFAPVSATEVTDRYDGAVIQSLLDRRLLVAVGEKLDTYWDIFRDFLNTGEVPIEDSYTIGLYPQAVAPVVSLVASSGGDVAISDLASALGASPRSLVNVSRTLRLLGITSYDLTRIRIIESILEAPEPEFELRRGVSRVLRRHKAFSLLLRLIERQPDGVAIQTYARELPQAFPAIDAQPSTWTTYARAFALWFDYAGLALFNNNTLTNPTEHYVGRGALLTSKPNPIIKVEHLHDAPGPSLRLLESMKSEPVDYMTLSVADRRAARMLAVLGLVQEKPGGRIQAAHGALVGGEVSGEAILEGLKRLPGGVAALAVLQVDGTVSGREIGMILKHAAGADWKDSTADGVGKHFRSWARVGGVRLARPKGDGSSAQPELPIAIPSAIDPSIGERAAARPATSSGP